MKKLSIILVAILISILMLVPTTPALADSNLEVIPKEYDFGEVEVGSSSSTIVSIRNSWYGPVILDALSFEEGSSPDFSRPLPPTLPVVIDPESSIDIVVTYTPSTLGSSLAVLEIDSTNGAVSTIYITLSGIGVSQEPPPSEQIQDILGFIDDSVTEGTLEGDGPGNSAGNRLNALKNMIESAGDLVDASDTSQACQQLLDAYKKCDGELKPPDFVTGSAAEELAGMIQALRASLGCE